MYGWTNVQTVSQSLVLVFNTYKLATVASLLFTRFIKNSMCKSATKIEDLC